ncbi:MAG TPA: phosphoribosyltransferase [Gaiellaceae bacterium]|jgi:predicted phosphoribosyltransferase|nr:phosphoribosyltransferase [Gaiellaceae bacterium]
MRFYDRKEAGRLLAERLSRYAGRDDVLVLGLPRGGVPVAYEVARALRAPLDVFVVRKLGAPDQPELALGAVASSGVRVLNEEVVAAVGVDEQAIEQVAERELAEVARREREYRGERAPPELRGKVVILIDDGLATGASMRAAALAARQLGPKQVVVAVPVAADQTCGEFRDDVDEVVCVFTPEPFYAVGLWYENFQQTNDEEVRRLLQEAIAA